MRSLLIGESASPELQERSRPSSSAAPRVRRVIHVLTQHIGPDELLVAAKVEFDPDLTTVQLVEAINAAEQRMRAIPGAGIARIYIEPDVGERESVAEASPAKPR